jgi:hypothetical protein
MTTVCTIEDIVEDVINNESLTADDVKQLEEFIGDDYSFNILIELLSIPRLLELESIDEGLIPLLYRAMRQNYSANNCILDQDAKQLIALIEPTDGLNLFEKRALKLLKNTCKYGLVFRNFLDDYIV